MGRIISPNLPVSPHISPASSTSACGPHYLPHISPISPLTLTLNLTLALTLALPRWAAIASDASPLGIACWAYREGYLHT